VQPDVLVRQVAKPIDGQLPTNGDDAVLSAALQAARQNVAKR
jgi:hypothetical protein